MNGLLKNKIERDTLDVNDEQENGIKNQVIHSKRYKEEASKYYAKKDFKAAVGMYNLGVQYLMGLKNHSELYNTEWAFDFENTIHTNLALINFVQKKYDESISHATFVLKRDKFNYKAHYRYAVAKWNSEQDKYDLITAA